MHLLLTDHLICARCGPGFGLILLADRLEDRRVIEGVLGCSNCRERYPVAGGFGELAPSPRTTEEGSYLDRADDPHGALQLAALLGVREGPGFLFLSGSAVRHADRLAAMIEGIEVVAAHPALRGDEESSGVTRLGVGATLPFRSGSLRGVAMEGASGAGRIEEGIRVLGVGSRLVLRGPDQGARERMDAAGLELVLEAEGVLVGELK
jgi:hypothetical protein